MITRRRKKPFALLVSAAFILLAFHLFPVYLRAGMIVKNGPFFLMGDGRVHIKNAHNGKEAMVCLLNTDGSLNEEAFTKIDQVFGFPTEEKGEHISPRMIFMLDYFSDLVASDKTIQLESGYRSPEYNSNLREAGRNAARTSFHIDGMAIDFSIPGVNGKELWNLIKSKNCCGVGHYGGATVHLDSGKPRFWEAATSTVKTDESLYNRHIYLSSDCDRYKPGDKLRLAFSSVSDFGFGIRKVVSIIDNAEEAGTLKTVQIESPRDADECIMVEDRKSSRFVNLKLPQSIREGRYRIRIDFCRRPFEQMPLNTVSNEFEVLR